jgi:hypothetical protein
LDSATLEHGSTLKVLCDLVLWQAGELRLN